MSRIADEKLRRLILELQLLEGSAETLQSRLRLVENAIREFQMANLTLEGLKKKGKGAQLLVPVGGGSYVKAGLEDDENVIFGIGAGIAVEKKVEDAQGTIGEQLSELEKTRGTLQQQLMQVAAQIEDKRSEIQAFTRRTSEGKGRVRETQKGA